MYEISMLNHFNQSWGGATEAIDKREAVDPTHGGVQLPQTKTQLLPNPLKTHHNYALLSLEFSMWWDPFRFTLPKVG